MYVNEACSYFGPDKMIRAEPSFWIWKVHLVELYLFHKHNRQRQFSPEEHMKPPSAAACCVRSLILMMSSPLRRALSRGRNIPFSRCQGSCVTQERRGESEQGCKTDRFPAWEVGRCSVSPKHTLINARTKGGCGGHERLSETCRPATRWLMALYF